MKNKLLVIFPIEGPLNGVKVITKNLLEYWDKEGFSFKLIDTAQAKDFNDFGKFSLKKVIDVLLISKKILLNKNSSDAYINLSVKGFSLYRDMLLIFLLLLKNIKVTAHIHANGLEKVQNFFLKSILNKIKLVVINNHQLEVLTAYKNVNLLPNSLPDFYTNEFNKSKNRKLNILYFSNLSIEKGVNRLSEFVKELEPLRDKIQINICGGILDDESNRVVKDVQQYDYVHLLNPIFDTEEKMKLFHQSDVFLFLSDENYEVFPLVYLEALMNGLVIITTKQIVAKDMIALNNGVFYQKNKNIEFIQTLLDHENLLVKQKSSRQIYLDKLNFEDFSTNLKKIIYDK